MVEILKVANVWIVWIFDHLIEFQIWDIISCSIAQHATFELRTEIKEVDRLVLQSLLDKEQCVIQEVDSPDVFLS